MPCGYWLTWSPYRCRSSDNYAPTGRVTLPGVEPVSAPGPRLAGSWERGLLGEGSLGRGVSHLILTLRNRLMIVVGAIGVASQHSTSIIEVSLEWHFDKGALGCVSLPKSFIIKETTGLS